MDFYTDHDHEKEPYIFFSVYKWSDIFLAPMIILFSWPLLQEYLYLLQF